MADDNKAPEIKSKREPPESTSDVRRGRNDDPPPPTIVHDLAPLSPGSATSGDNDTGDDSSEFDPNWKNDDESKRVDKQTNADRFAEKRDSTAGAALVVPITAPVSSLVLNPSRSSLVIPTSSEKILPVCLSPVDKDPRIRAKRKLWDVDSSEIDDTLCREIKRIHKEEHKIKSSRWNFDFEREVPLEGEWKWHQESDPPNFYKQKVVDSKNSVTQVSSSVTSAGGEGEGSSSRVADPSQASISSSTPSISVPSASSSTAAASHLPPPPGGAEKPPPCVPATIPPESTNHQRSPASSSSSSSTSSPGSPNQRLSPPPCISTSSFYSSSGGDESKAAYSSSKRPLPSSPPPATSNSSSHSKKKPKRRRSPPNGSSLGAATTPGAATQTWIKHFR